MGRQQNQTWGQAQEFKALGSRDLPMSRQAMHSSIMGHGYGIKPVISAGGRTKGVTSISQGVVRAPFSAGSSRSRQ